MRSLQARTNVSAGPAHCMLLRVLAFHRCSSRHSARAPVYKQEEPLNSARVPLIIAGAHSVRTPVHIRRRIRAEGRADPVHFEFAYQAISARTKRQHWCVHTIQTQCILNSPTNKCQNERTPLVRAFPAGRADPVHSKFAYQATNARIKRKHWCAHSLQADSSPSGSAGPHGAGRPDARGSARCFVRNAALGAAANGPEGGRAVAVGALLLVGVRNGRRRHRRP